MRIALALLLAAAAPLSASDRAFVSLALNGNTAEIQQAQIFANSTDPLVAAFAKRMIQDHSAANTQLIALADASGMKSLTRGQLPENPYSATTTHTASLSAQQKDKNIAGQPPVAYFTRQVRTHEQAVTLYQHEIAKGSDPPVLAYARKTLPVIQAHLALAKRDLAQEKAKQHG